MKKLLLILSTTLFVLTLAAQSPIQIVSQTYGNVNSQTFTFYITNGQEIQEDFDVYYNGSPAPSMKIRKTHDTLQGASRAWFCTGTTCYSDATSLSYAFPGAAGTVLQTHFKQSLTVCDTNLVRYTAFDVNNPSDSAWIQIIYYCVGGPVGVDEVQNVSQLTAYPNPASNLLQLSFDAPKNNAQIEVYNQLGERVHLQQIAALTTTASLDVSTLPNGIFMLRLVTDDSILSKQTIVVQH